MKQVWVGADKDASSNLDFDEFCDAVAKMPSTLRDRQESMKELQKMLGGKSDDGAEKEKSQCLVM